MTVMIIKENNLYGAANQAGDIIIEPQYEAMRNFSNGLAAVRKKNKWGYVNQEGEQVIDYLYNEAKDFSVHGVAIVKRTNRPVNWGLINQEGALITTDHTKNYLFIDEFNTEGYARAGVKDGYQIIDVQGIPVDYRLYQALKYLPEQHLFVGDAVGKSCLIDREGEIIVEADRDFDKIYPPSNGLFKVVRNNKYGYIDADGYLTIPLKYQAADDFADNGLAYVTYPSGKGGYINKAGTLVIEPRYDSGSSFRFGLAAVSEDGEYIYINRRGQKVINAAFKYASGFAECGLAKTVSFDERHGLVRPDSTIPLSLKKGCELFEFVGNSQVTKFRVDGKEALINSEGEIITGLNYDNIHISGNSDWHPFVRNGWWGYLDNEGKHATPIIYQKTAELTAQHAALIGAYYPDAESIGNLYVIGERPNRLAKQARQSIREKFAKVGPFEDGLAFAVKKKQTIVLERRGKEINTVDSEQSPEVADAVDYEMKHYEIVISLEGKWTTEQTRQLLERYFDSEEILEVSGPHAKFVFSVPAEDYEGELEIFMYYFLDAEELGTYDYRQLN